MMKLLLLISSLVATSSSAFIFGEPMVRDPHLTEYLDRQSTEQKLKLHLDIGPRRNKNSNTDPQPRMPITNFGLSLHKTKKTGPPSSSFSPLKLPGAHGSHPQLSAGACELTVDRPGQFITIHGAQSIDVNQASWELVWKKDAQAGSLIMGFDIAHDYERNGITFPHGVVYVNFPVWSKEGLSVAREVKNKTIQRAKDALKDRDEEIVKMESTSNLLMKAWHYRNIYAAIETYSLLPIKHYNECIPEENEVIELPGELYLTTKGFCWTKDLPWGKEEVLGTAQLAVD
jgi:hypothetical protein